MNDRKKNFSTNEISLLLNQVNGICPICSLSINYSISEDIGKIYEIAHIYPLNPTLKEINELKNLERLNGDLNHLDNLICLCRNCHKKFDHPRTKEGYISMLNIKKNLILKDKERALYKDDIDLSLKKIVEILASGHKDTLFENIDLISYNPKVIDEKIKGIGTDILKRKVKGDVDYYFYAIKNFFILQDNEEIGTTEQVSTEIKLMFVRMFRLYGENEEKVVIGITEWLQNKTKSESRIACEIMVSYFIQNCEIF